MKPATITRLTGVSRPTLHNWKKNKPELYAVVLLGCEIKLLKEKCDKDSENTPAI